LVCCDGRNSRQGWTFPGDHGAIVSRPGSFAETLHEILIG
jgi:hypothetical protein